MLVMTLLKVALGCALLLIFLRPMPAHAGALYRCAGSQGEVVFSGTKVGYHDCKLLSSYAPAPAPSHPSVSQHVASQEGTSLAWVRGWADTTATAIAPIVASLDHVEAGVDTTAHAIPHSEQNPNPNIFTGKPGQWTYSQSPDALPASLASSDVADSADNRVLRGAVYRVVRRDGSVEYTNIAPSGKQPQNVTKLFSYIATCMACDLHSPIHWDTVHLNTTDYASIIHQASLESGVDEAFIRAIIHAESAFNPRAMSMKGAQGLMQLMPLTANNMGVVDAFDPEQNIRGGARYLSLLLKYFNGDRRLTAAAYNAGPAAVQHYNGVPPFAETQVYVERVGELLQRYDKALHAPLPASM
jgi:soluble lytic murein transglycosylase-like protein